VVDISAVCETVNDLVKGEKRTISASRMSFRLSHTVFVLIFLLLTLCFVSNKDVFSFLTGSETASKTY
jgi:hypothetical protein